MTTITPYAEGNGYTQIDNALIDYVMPNIDANDWRVLCFIIRKTRGWHKESDRISLSQLEKGTGASRPTVAKSIKRLEEGGHILVDRKTRTNNMSLNPDFVIDTAKELNNLTSKETLPPNSKETLPIASKKTLHTKETNTKENRKKETPPPAKPTPTHYANMEARDALATLPQPIQELAQVVSDVTLQPINAKVIDVAYTLFGYDAEPDDVRRLFSGAGCYWLKAGAGSWDDGSPRPYPGNIASDWRRAVEWAETNTSGGELAKLYEAYIEPLKEKSGDELRASVLSLPSDIKTRLTALGVNQIGQIVRLSAAQFAGGG